MIQLKVRYCDDPVTFHLAKPAREVMRCQDCGELECRVRGIKRREELLLIQRECSWFIQNLGHSLITISMHMTAVMINMRAGASLGTVSLMLRM